MTPDEASDESSDEAEELEGAAIINVSWIGTGVFVATAAIATVFPDGFAVPALVVSFSLFFIGCIAFFWAYAVAVQRSRTDLIGIGGLYFLSGTAPKVVRVRLLSSLAVEVVVAIVTSSIRLYSALAFGFLVPVFGLGMCGLWGARYGTFDPRPPPEPKKPRKAAKQATTAEPAKTDTTEETEPAESEGSNE
jgi:hypothetical protein